MLQPWGNRTSFSTTQLGPYWNYAIENDFQSPTGEPAVYAPGHPQSWDVDEVHKITYTERVSSISLNADETLLAIAVGEKVIIYSISEQREVHVLDDYEGRVEEVFWVPGNEKVLVTFVIPIVRNRLEPLTPPAIVIHNIDNPALRHQFDGELIRSDRNAVSCDGRGLLFRPDDVARRSRGDYPYHIHVYDFRTRGVRCKLDGHVTNVGWAGFSPDGLLVGTAGDDSTFRIYDAATGELRHELLPSRLDDEWIGEFSPTGERFVGTNNSGDVYVWSTATGDLITSFDFINNRQRRCVTFDWSPDGQYLALGGIPMATVLVVDFRPGDLANQPSINQRRCLSAKDCEESVRKHMVSFLETTQVTFLANGRLALKMSGDRGLEVYDFAKNEKKRFGPLSGEMSPQEGRTGRFVICEQQGLIVSVDTDAIRFWKI